MLYKHLFVYTLLDICDDLCLFGLGLDQNGFVLWNFSCYKRMSISANQRNNFRQPSPLWSFGPDIFERRPP